MKSVWRQRKAGVWEHVHHRPRPRRRECPRARSVRTGTPTSSRTRSRIRSPSATPGTAEARLRGPVGLVEGGFVDEADGEPGRDPPAAFPADSRASRSDSMTHGPAIRNSGRSGPDLEAAEIHRRTIPRNGGLGGGPAGHPVQVHPLGEVRPAGSGFGRFGRRGAGARTVPRPGTGGPARIDRRAVMRTGAKIAVTNGGPHERLEQGMPVTRGRRV